MGRWCINITVLALGYSGILFIETKVYLIRGLKNVTPFLLFMHPNQQHLLGVVGDAIFPELTAEIKEGFLCI